MYLHAHVRTYTHPSPIQACCPHILYPVLSLQTFLINEIINDKLFS